MSKVKTRLVIASTTSTQNSGLFDILIPKYEKSSRYNLSVEVIAVVGAILIVGGNIAGFTRVMTTTIALETDKGNFDLALALGLILLAISMAINSGMHIVQKKGVIGVN